MPDPFLFCLNFDADYKSSQDVVAFYGAEIQQSGRLVFLNCKNSNGQMLLAQINCTNYPDILPDVTFLNPLNRQPTVENRFWPAGVGKVGSSLCLAGTSVYGKAHSSTSVTYSLTTLIELLILCCKGETHRLRLMPGR